MKSTRISPKFSHLSSTVSIIQLSVYAFIFPSTTYPTYMHRIKSQETRKLQNIRNCFLLKSQQLITRILYKIEGIGFFSQIHSTSLHHLLPPSSPPIVVLIQVSLYMIKSQFITSGDSYYTYNFSCLLKILCSLALLQPHGSENQVSFCSFI